MLGRAVLLVIACTACRAPAKPSAASPRVATVAAPAAPASASVDPEPDREPSPTPEPTPEPTAEPPQPCPQDRRDASQKPDHVVALLAISPGMTVVDLGAGNGYFLCHLSRAVGPSGRVVATEIGKRLVRSLEKLVEKSELANVEVVLAPKSDVGVTAVDRILLVNVWHHIANRRRYAKKLASALAPGGRVVIVDFPFNKKSGHGVGHTRAIADLQAGGFDAALSDDQLAGQYVIVATRRSN